MKLELGTVEFGIDGYSLLNTGKPRPSGDAVVEMLDFAHAHGVEFVDTANAYGDAEDRIAVYGAGKFKVTSKLKPNCLEGLSDDEVLPKIKAELQTDLKRLGISQLWGYYFHTPEYIYNRKAFAALMECKKEGLVSNIGVSIYEPKDALYAVRQGIDIIQVPYNVLDQRLYKVDFFHIAKENGVIVFARSPFLKGLLTMSVDKIPSYLKQAETNIRLVDKIVNRYHFRRIEACLFFSLMEKDIDYVVFGADNISHLQHDIVLNELYESESSAIKSFGDCYAELRASFEIIDDYIVMPSLWKKE
jgi:aryl-alcohol dehydrogenase-like predicted oxidoreductase